MLTTRPDAISGSKLPFIIDIRINIVTGNGPDNAIMA